jgi:hypothetical protein
METAGLKSQETSKQKIIGSYIVAIPISGRLRSVSAKINDELLSDKFNLSDPRYQTKLTIDRKCWRRRLNRPMIEYAPMIYQAGFAPCG